MKTKNIMIALTLLTTGTAWAEDFPKDSLKVVDIEEVVVIATPKENRKLRELPVATTLLSQKDMQANQVHSVKNLTGIVPNLFIPDYGSKLTTSIYIRGIGSRINTPSVGLYVDNIPYIDKSAFDFNYADIERIVEAFREICAVDCKEDGVQFACDKIEPQNITEFKDYHGIRLSIPVTMDSIAQVLTMDIGFGDVVTPHPVSLDYPLLLEGLPEASILAYSTETVIAEKMHAIIDLADQSSRMKDYYDIYHLLTSFQYDTAILQDAINHTFENRHTPYNADTMFFREDFPNHPQMQVRWTAFLRKATINSALSFPEVARWLQDTLRPYWTAYGRMQH